MMEWAYFYDKYSELSDSKLKSYISLLEDIDSGEELVNAVVDIENKDIKALLVRKAMEFNVEFTQDDFYSLDGEIPTDLYVKLAREGNITFGTNDEVAQTLASIFDDAANEALYKRAIKSGVKFTQEQLEWIGKDEDEEEITDEDEEEITDEDEEEIVDTDEELEEKEVVHDSKASAASIKKKSNKKTNDAFDYQSSVASAWAKRYQGGND